MDVELDAGRLLTVDEVTDQLSVALSAVTCLREWGEAA
jgi:hypothetical protein